MNPPSLQFVVSVESQLQVSEPSHWAIEHERVWTYGLLILQYLQSHGWQTQLLAIAFLAGLTADIPNTVPHIVVAHGEEFFSPLSGEKRKLGEIAKESVSFMPDGTNLAIS